MDSDEYLEMAHYEMMNASKSAGMDDEKQLMVACCGAITAVFSAIAIELGAINGSLDRIADNME